MRFDVHGLTAEGRARLTIEAANPDQAAEQAKRKGLTVLSVRGSGGARFLARRYRFPLVMFSRELLALLASGLSLVESLQTLEEKETRPEAREVLSGVLRRLHDGESFSSAIAQQPEAFPPLIVATVRASEKTSDLPQALARYVAYEEQVDRVRKKVISSAIYPLMLLILGTAVALFLMIYVVPRFSQVYEGNLDRLPFASRLMMEWGSFMSAHMTVAGVALLAIVAGGYALFKQSQVRALVFRQFWRIPAIGERLHTFQLTRFYRTAGMLLSGGIPIVTALGMASGLLNPELRQRLERASTGIREGKSISQAMDAAALTTPVATRMLRVGEKSGRMGEMMESIAAFYDDEIARSVEWFTRLFEPILMLVIGLLIGAILVLLYMPIFDLAGSLN
jgi:general secretion pathway protein F